MANQIPMTRNGVEMLKQELQQLKSVDRPNIIQAIAEARAQGDLSENAEYESAKEKQGFIEGRIADIEAKLSNVQIIDPANLNADGKCVFGSTIEIENLDEEELITYQIVGEDEADIKSKKISVSSPLARALIGKEEGDVVEVQTPGGTKNYELVSVKYI
jgi:transcription elongation factor GreA